MTFDSWLTEDDIQRLWDVVHGNLAEEFATHDEVQEFSRIVMHAAMTKVGGAEYETAVIQ
jgi:hypothetical protein